MIRPLKLAHTSDVHLHDGEAGQHVRDAFARVIDTVLAVRSDLFLIAGDLFDHNRVKGDVIDFVYEQLARVHCPTVIIAGNHDCWEERSVLRRMDFRHAGHHVTLLDEAEGRQIEFPELHATVWGRCMLDHDRGNKPLAGAPPRKGNLWHIGMAHGLYMEDPDSDRSSLITPHEIEHSGFDYLALGHVHAHRQMRHGDTLACYPGVPMPYYGTDESGEMTLVELTPGAGARAVVHALDRPASQAAARKRSTLCAKASG
ncbi:MAG TPA: DNA repair exonuclease [Burkholderiales bacterium]|nr:DNA repair exonuclease [Burkholderiales bacterium]